MISPKKIDVLLSPIEMRKIFKRKSKKIGISPSEIKRVQIKVIKEYIDWRSFSLVALYWLNKEKKIIGIANSDGKKEYTFKVNNLVFKRFSKIKTKKYSVPKPYCYIKSLGLFLEEFLTGGNFGKILKKGEGIKSVYIKRLAEMLFFLQKVNVSKSLIKEGIDFYDIKKNIRILKERKEKGGKKIAEIFKRLEKKIRGCERKNKNKVLVHGDFNPYNLFFEKDKVKLIDFGSTHRGDRVSDLANIFTHLETTLDFKIPKKKEKFLKDSLLKNYQKIAGEFNSQEEEKFKIYKDYFNLLNLSHVMVWGNIPQKAKASRKISELIL